MKPETIYFNNELNKMYRNREVLELHSALENVFNELYVVKGDKKWNQK